MQTLTLPRGFVVSHPTMDDIHAVQELFAACEVALDGKVETTLDDLRVWWQMPDFHLATDAWIVRSPEGKIIALSSISHQEHARIYCGGDVHPAYRRRGIGSYLLSLNEARALLHIPEAAPDVRVSLLSQINQKDTAAIQLLEKHGYPSIRSSWRMAIELKEVPQAPVWAEGLTVRRLAGDMSMAHAVYEADEESFKDHWGHIPHTFEEFQYWMTKRENYDPTLWFLAMDGNEIAGIALCQDEKEQGGWVHSLGVRRQWRRKGVGLALLHHAFGEFYRRGIRTVYLGVDAQSLTGATRLYERAGMHIVRQYITYEKELRAGKELSTQSLDG